MALDYRHMRGVDVITSGRLVDATTVCRRARITYRQLDYWCVVYPDHMPIAVTADGSGSIRWYHAADIPKYHVLGRLSSRGLRVNRLLQLTHQQRLQLIGRIRKLWREAEARDA
jgi:hypothetical protein